MGCVTDCQSPWQQREGKWQNKGEQTTFLVLSLDFRVDFANKLERCIKLLSTGDKNDYVEMRVINYTYIPPKNRLIVRR